MPTWEVRLRDDKNALELLAVFHADSFSGACDTGLELARALARAQRPDVVRTEPFWKFHSVRPLDSWPE